MRRLAAAAIAVAAAASAVAAEPLTVATWNLEWMMQPAVFDALAPACFGRGARAGGGERAIPCDLDELGAGRAVEHDAPVPGDEVHDPPVGIPRDLLPLCPGDDGT